MVSAFKTVLKVLMHFPSAQVHSLHETRHNASWSATKLFGLLTNSLAYLVLHA